MKCPRKVAVTDGNMHRVLKGLDLYPLFPFLLLWITFCITLSLKDMWRLRGTCKDAQMCVESFLKRECRSQISFYWDHGIDPITSYINDLRKLQHDCLS